MNDRDEEPDMEDIENARVEAHTVFTAKSNEAWRVYDAADAPLREARDRALNEAYREFCAVYGYSLARP